MLFTGTFDKNVGVTYNFVLSKQKDIDLWNTDGDFTYTIGDPADQKFVTVPAGFLTDGASVPRIFWDLFPPWGVYGQAAILHDWLCTNRVLTKNGDSNELKLTQQEVDLVLAAAMKALGTPWWKRTLIYRAVWLYHALGYV